ncbi:TPA: MAPEG family protein [Klebsiella aerogenes]|uniref:MAPEG family protein n=1 Tax=Klebsiella TaxID=570 RepID=UPI0027821051|nr:MAPEG family protein [Klebsiella aerogenes]MDT8881829.1 MAPEG family protein [Klebsiella aerogenes]HBU9919624.1 MAPEG family protein [Klebsiella aerogenes]HBV4469176.1 MAPEG family protein [Klebsiella aerogenes]HCM6941158.1 MAPEG family protein [Klebsiella aerogenes]HDT1383273.1 MAPEG family protein [Klebsiella aerogenes]
MKNNPELIILALICLLTVMMWIPYIIARATRVNVAPAAGNGHSPSSGLAPWAQRAQKAHANAVENLVIFAPLVVVAALLNVNNAITLIAAKVYLLARIVHYIAYTAGIPIIRTLAFQAGFVATVTIAIVILSSVF